MDRLSDSELIEACLAGNRAAFGLLAERYRVLVLQVAYSTVRQSDIAHDLAQESLLRAFLSLGQLREASRFRGWLYGITLNVCHEFIRLQRRSPVSLEELAGGIHLADEMPSPESLAEALELREMMQGALNRLTEGNRAVMLMFYYEGFSTEEIAEILGISLSAVKVRMHKARQQLKSYLEAVLPVVHYKKGAKTMIPVILADTRSQETTGSGGKTFYMYQTVLFDEQSRRAIVIWIGEAEAIAIASGMKKDVSRTAMRPITQVLMGNLLKAAGSSIEAVEIAKIENNIFYASVKVKTSDGNVREVDSRPSDALALAVWHDIPIFVSEKLFEEIGVAVPEGKKAYQRGIEEIVNRVFSPPPQPVIREATPEEIEAFEKARPSAEAYKKQVQELIQKVIDMVFE
jgi:RNA polymerase sigma factor (sigma-70 family)